MELKFNPYHDARNGRFTFAPGGIASAGESPLPRSRRETARGPTAADRVGDRTVRSEGMQNGRVSDAVYRPAENAAQFMPASFPRVPRAPRGSNIRAFYDPMTLEQTFPGLQNNPGGAIMALADGIFDFTGPAKALTDDLNRAYSERLIEQIKAVDPTYVFQSFGFPKTTEGQNNQIKGLRFQRAAAFLKVHNELRPMQVETLRFVQAAVDRAYERGLIQLRLGKLPVRLSDREALGNFIDREVRIGLREIYAVYGIDAAGAGPVRVNRREMNRSESTYRRPDARVGSIAFDVTLSAKSLKTPQIRGFFAADFKPSHVIIVRPSQIGSNSSYIITRPETK